MRQDRYKGRDRKTLGNSAGKGGVVKKKTPLALGRVSIVEYREKVGTFKFGTLGRG